jgi:anhydro-N-acetylmuramic acid kinase
MLSIGLMSGTSMDGIDAALLETEGSENFIKEQGNIFVSYDAQFKILLKAAEFATRKSNGNLQVAKTLYTDSIKEYLIRELNVATNHIDRHLRDLQQYLYSDDVPSKPIALEDVILHSTDLHADAVKRLLMHTGYQSNQIDVIGYHGQTLFHRPSVKISIVVGDGQYLANHLGITVVNDFRSRDIAAGGQGAPFAPLYHQALAMRDKKIPVAVVNCGGIANVTLISSNNELDLIAFDTGPGNGLIDQFVRKFTQGKENMDTDGKYGGQGIVQENVLAALFEKSIIKDGINYFAALPPKSLDIGDMQLIPEIFSLSFEDACATLEAFTAESIIDSLRLVTQDLPNQWILAGGGWNNPVIRRELQNRLRKKLGDNVSIMTAQQAGWNGQALEAQIFAYFAVRSLQNKCLSLPKTTNVPSPLSGGRAYIPSIGSTKKVAELLALNPSVLSG